jgi:multidrug resistance efflux pump
MRPALSILRLAITGAMIVVAAILATALWQHYMLEPWTRDGRVQAYPVVVASEVSGRVVALPLVDNQFVHKGDVLAEIDPTDYKLALASAQAMVENQRQTMNIRQSDARRRQVLNKAGVASSEVTEDFTGNAAVAAANSQRALVDQNKAEVNLSRTVIRSPVNGYVTNLDARVGDYATSGHPVVTVVDSDSFWITGYFEETKLAAIKPGIKASAKLLGYPGLVEGHVESISRGIANPNAAGDRAGLAQVSPVFTWVRLAQRFPVRIHIDTVPADVVLAAGMTCTVTILPSGHGPQGLGPRLRQAVATLGQVLRGNTAAFTSPET